MARALGLALAGIVLVGSVLWFAARSRPAAAPSSHTTTPPAATTSATPWAASSPAAGSVFVIIMENRSYDQALQSPYLASLARQYGLATNYQAVSHPSLPNYLALTSGSTYGITDDAYHPLPPGGLGAQLTAAGLSWKAYTEGFNGDCLNSPYPYAVKHNPFAYYGGGCPANVVPMTEVNTDLSTGGVPRLAWLTPGLCNDGHDCPNSTADAWLQPMVTRITASAAWQRGGVLYITYDENDGAGGNHVATLVVAPNLTRHTTATPYNHYSLLATIEDRLGVGRLGQAAAAAPITDLFGAGAPTPG